MAETTNTYVPRSIKATMTDSQVTFANNGTPTGVTTQKSSSQDSYTNFRTGVKNSRWRWQVRNVVNATTYASGEMRKISYGGYQLALKGRTIATLPPTGSGPYKRDIKVSGDVYLSSPARPMTISNVNSGALTSAYNQAVAKLYNQLTSFQQSAQTGEDLGELSQTVKLLRHPFKPMRDFTLTLMRKHERALLWNNPDRAIKEMANIRLEWNFGIKPLLKTIAGAVVGLQNRDVMAFYQPFSAHGISAHDGLVSNPSNNSGHIAARMNLITSSSQYVRFKGVWGVGVNIDKVPVERALGLTAPDLIPTIYNLIPWSWAIDAISNLGTVMDAFAVPWGGVRWCNRTDRTTTVHTSTMEAITQSLLVEDLKFMSPGYYKCHGVAFFRAPVTVMPIPELELHPIASGAQYWNLAAALTQKLPVIGKLTKEFIRKNPEAPHLFGYEIRKQRRS